MGEDALGDGAQWPTLDMGLLLQQGRRRCRIDPFAFHQDPTGLLHPGVMLHGKRQLRGKPLLLAGAGQLQGRHDHPGKGDQADGQQATQDGYPRAVDTVLASA